MEFIELNHLGNFCHVAINPMSFCPDASGLVPRDLHLQNLTVSGIASFCKSFVAHHAEPEIQTSSGIAQFENGVLQLTTSNGITASGAGNVLHVSDLQNVTPFIVGTDASNSQFTSINAAYSAAAAVASETQPQMVLVKAGVYYETLLLTSPYVALQGLSDGRPGVVRIQGTGHIFNVPGGDPVSISGLTFVGTSGGTLFQVQQGNLRFVQCGLAQLSSTASDVALLLSGSLACDVTVETCALFTFGATGILCESTNSNLNVVRTQFVGLLQGTAQPLPFFVDIGAGAILPSPVGIRGCGVVSGSLRTQGVGNTIVCLDTFFFVVPAAFKGATNHVIQFANSSVSAANLLQNILIVANGDISTGTLIHAIQVASTAQVAASGLVMLSENILVEVGATAQLRLYNSTLLSTGPLSSPCITNAGQLSLSNNVLNSGVSNAVTLSGGTCDASANTFQVGAGGFAFDVALAAILNAGGNNVTFGGGGNTTGAGTINSFVPF